MQRNLQGQAERKRGRQMSIRVEFADDVEGWMEMFAADFRRVRKPPSVLQGRFSFVEDGGVEDRV